MFTRDATLDDLPHITSILNFYIANSVMTFRTEQLPLDPSPLFDTYHSVRERGLPFIVALEDGKVVGYCLASPYNWPGRKAYKHTAEISICVHRDWQGRGVGTLLMNELMGELKRTDISEVLCAMALNPEGPGDGYKLRDWYGRWGFAQAGHMKRVGFKFGRWLDTLILQASIGRDA